MSSEVVMRRQPVADLPAVRRHGYLLACVVTKPAAAPVGHLEAHQIAIASQNGRTGGAR